MARMLATDLDGTLLRADGSVSDRTVAALARAREAGFPVLFVTGRPPRWMEPVVRATGHAGVAVCANGALVVDLDEGTVLAASPLPAEDVLAAADRLRHAVPGVAFGIELVPSPVALAAAGAEPALAAARLGERSYAHEPHYLPDDDARYGPLVGTLGELLGHGEVVKLLARGPAGTDPDAFLGVARSALGTTAEVTRSMDVPLIEIAATGVSKASTLAAYARGLGIGPAEVAAAGDMPNDVPMLRWAGRAYAVDGAHPDALAATTGRIRGPGDDGVAVLLESLLDGDRAVLTDRR